MSVSLKAGSNLVVYTGKAQSASNAFASIISYLEIAYYYNNITASYEQVITTTTMVPYGVYSIDVTQNCTWTYGADATPPTSVQLSSGSNIVAYSGPSQSIEDAFASIWNYWTGALYYDNTAKYWYSVFSGYTMVPNTPYLVGVTQNCIWTFVAPAFKGTITRGELEYDSSRAAVPATNIPQGSNVRVHFWGRNGMSVSQHMAMSWVVKDPDGLGVESYSPGETWPYVGAGSEHEFIGGRFNLDKVGTYTISAGLLMNPDNPIYVDTYYGDLCTVVAAVPEVPCEITITAPNSAAEGEKISVSALLKNVSSYGAMYKTEISAVPDLFPAFRIGTIEKYINSGSSFTAYGSFTMPASNTTILIWVERWAVDHWVYDNSASKVVSLEVVPEYKGSIARKELEYDETRGAIPVY